MSLIKSIFFYRESNDHQKDPEDVLANGWVMLFVPHCVYLHFNVASFLQNLIMLKVTPKTWRLERRQKILHLSLNLFSQYSLLDSLTAWRRTLCKLMIFSTSSRLYRCLFKPPWTRSSNKTEWEKEACNHYSICSASNLAVISGHLVWNNPFNERPNPLKNLYRSIIDSTTD